MHTIQSFASLVFIDMRCGSVHMHIFQSIMMTESLEEILFFLEWSGDNFLPKSTRKDIWPERGTWASLTLVLPSLTIPRLPFPLFCMGLHSSSGHHLLLKHQVCGRPCGTTVFDWPIVLWPQLHSPSVKGFMLLVWDSCPKLAAEVKNHIVVSRSS